MRLEVLIDQVGAEIRVVIFEFDDNGVRSVRDISAHGAPVDMDTLTDFAMNDPITWGWTDAVELKNIDPQLWLYVKNHRRLKLLEELKGLLDEEEKLNAQLLECRSAIQGLRGLI